MFTFTLQACTITRKGAVSIQGAIQGGIQEPVKIVSFQDVTIAKEVRGADIKTSGEVIITGDIVDSSIMAQDDITGERSGVRSQLYSQSRIRLGECGDEQRGQCLLVVKPRECREISQELFKIDAKMLELQNEMNSLRSLVDTVKKLGRGIDQLSEEKKREFAWGIKQFKEVEGALSSFCRRFQRLRENSPLPAALPHGSALYLQKETLRNTILVPGGAGRLYSAATGCTVPGYRCSETFRPAS